MTGDEVLVLMYTLKLTDAVKLAEALLYKKLRVQLLPMKRRLYAMTELNRPQQKDQSFYLAKGLIECELERRITFFLVRRRRGAFENQDSSWVEQILKSRSS
jgi:hypothetical protein